MEAITNEEFIRRSEIIHQHKYKYDKVNYINSSTKVEIYCNTCKKYFCQTPNAHLQKHGCWSCGKEKSRIDSLRTKEEFIKQAREIHNEKYDYSEVKYVKGTIKVDIKCNSCDLKFQQKPNNHLQGQGCPKCKYKKLSEQFGNIAHGWRYSDWEKKALNSKHFDSFKVYIIECYNDEERFIKIGRSFVTIKNRFKGKENLPYKYNVLKEIIFETAKECCEYEALLKRINISYKYSPLIKFGGMYECFTKFLLE